MGKKVEERRTWDDAVKAFWEDRDRERILKNRPQELHKDQHLRMVIEKILAPQLSGKYLDELTGELLEDMAVRMCSSPGNKGKPLKPASALKYFNTVMAVLRAAKADRRKWIDRLPDKPKLAQSPASRRAISMEDIVRLVKVMNPHYQRLTVFGLNTGLRASNVAKLRWDQVDREKRRAIFSEIVMKNGEVLGIPLNDVAMEVIEAQWNSKDWRGQPNRHPIWVFPGKGGKPRQKLTRSAWHAAVKAAGLPERTTFHSLRHTFCSHLMEAGADALTVMKLGGWRSQSMVQRYDHQRTETLRPWSDKACVRVGAGALQSSDSNKGT